MRKLFVGSMGLSMLLLLGVASAPAALANGHHVMAASAKTVDPTVYDSIVDPNPGNLPSVGFEATQGYEIGNQIDLSGTARILENVVVQMSSWGCEQGSWTGTFAYAPSSTPLTDPCVSTPGDTFSEPITLTIYQAPTLGPSAPAGTLIQPGSVIASETETFNIPYRPSADSNFATDCAADATQQNVNVSTFNGTWYDSAIDPTTGSPYGCLNGLIDNITFDFGHVTLPSSVVYGISYNTSDYGSPAYGDATACHATQEGCGYDSLNVGMSDEPASPSVGTDPNPGTIYWETTYAPYYCDSGAAGVGVFRLDSPGSGNNCWAPLIPAVQFNAVNNSAPSITSVAQASVVAGTPFSFTITTTGVPAPTITATRLPRGLTLVQDGDGTATISGTALKTDHNKTYVVPVRAKNAIRNSVAKQRLMLTLTGGR